VQASKTRGRNLVLKLSVLTLWPVVECSLDVGELSTFKTGMMEGSGEGADDIGSRGEGGSGAIFWAIPAAMLGKIFLKRIKLLDLGQIHLQKK